MGLDTISISVSDNSLVIATIVLAIVTSILALLTGLYWNETRLTRKIAQTPSFTLEPFLYSIGGSFNWIYLVNTGQTAKNIEVDVLWRKNDTTQSDSKKYFILSLGKDGRSNLHDVPIQEIIENKNILNVKIKCKDAKNDDFEETLQFNFSEIIKNDRQLGFQFDPLLRMANSLNDIQREIGSIKSELSNLRHR